MKKADKREILIPASVRIAREKAAARLQAARERTAAKMKLAAARQDREITKAVLNIVRALDRKAALQEREAAKLDRKAQRIAFQLARKDRLAEQRLLRRAHRELRKHKRRKTLRSRRPPAPKGR